MMLIRTLILSGLVSTSAYAQLMVPHAATPRPVSNPAMVIQFGSHRIEVLPTLRAVKQDNEQYRLVEAGTSEVMNKDKLGVGYSYASNAKILMTGEINVRLKAGYSLSSLGSLAARSKLLLPPDLYVVPASTPVDLVGIMGVLQDNPAVEWFEPFITRARLSE